MSSITTDLTFGLFANFENPDGDSRRALKESVATVQHAERLGFDEAWVTEHHFNRFSVSASIFTLLAHLAGVTSAIRLGTAAVLLPMHDILRVAEDAATVDALSDGRLMLGVARGGPFPGQFSHFGIQQEESRARMLEALPLLERLLSEETVDFAGRWHNYEQVSVYPRPLQARIPLWLASMSEDSIALAATRGYGLMGPSPAPIEKLQAVLSAYRAQTDGNEQPFVLSRFFFCHRDRNTAIAQAVLFVRDFARNMGAALQQSPNAAGGGPPAAFGVGAEALVEERILANSIIGDIEECADRVRALKAALGGHTLILKPAAYDPAANREALTLFSERVRPLL